MENSFRLARFTKSATAQRYKYHEQFAPPELVIDNLERLYDNVVHPFEVALMFENPAMTLVVTSGYRCPRLNTKIKGARNSQHKTGEAVDLVLYIDGVERNDILVSVVKKFFKINLFDQIIIEYGKINDPEWIHISYGREVNRRQVLRKESGKPYKRVEFF